MPLQSSGAISLSQIQTEFGGSNPISLNEYYSAADGIPSSGTISMNQFYGKAAGGQYSSTPPAWVTSSPSTTYTIPGAAGTNYGMATDSFSRNLYLWPRFWSTVANKTQMSIIPITASGLDTNNVKHWYFNNGDFYNSFGGWVDTVRGMVYHCRYASTNIYGVTTGSYFVNATSANPTANQNSGNQAYSGATSTYSAGFNNNDGGFHWYDPDATLPGDTDFYIWGGRGGANVRYKNLSGGTWNGTYTNLSTNITGWYTSQVYGLSRDRDTGWWVIAHRNNSISIVNPEFWNSSTGNYIQTFNGANAEDAVVGWNGKLYTFTGNTTQVKQWDRV